MMINYVPSISPTIFLVLQIAAKLNRYGMMLREDRHQRLLPHLPLLSQLPNNREIIIDWMSDDHMTETYELIQQCAEDGHGFGVDEFQNEEEFRDEIRESFCFVVIDERTKELIASFIMTSSKFYRGSPDAVDPYIIVRPNDRQKGIGEFCMRKVLEFSEILGYQGMYVDTFCNNLGMQKIISKLGGFIKCGCLPMGGKLKNGNIVASLIFFRDLTKYSNG